MENVDVELGELDIIDHTVQLLLECKERGRNHKNQYQPFIKMVPNAFRDLSPSSFNPRLVAIGPLHKADKNLQDFEVEKETHLHEFLCRLDSSPEKILKECVQKVSGSINQIKASYAGMMPFNDIELAKMMVTDGCFILDFLYKFSVGNESEMNSNPIIITLIIFDFLLVENQIPFFVLKDIFKCTLLKSYPTASVTVFILPLLEVIMASLFPADDPGMINNVGVDMCDDHMLGLLHKSYRFACQNVSTDSSMPKFHSATELDRAGVSFKPNEHGTSLMAMKLEISRFAWLPWTWCKPTLRMPLICIQDSTEKVLRNLIAYEQSSQVPNYVTSYAYAMHMLIDTPDDIAKLVESKVVNNVLASNERAANMLKSICKETLIRDFAYQEQWQQLDRYYSSYWPTQIAGLKRTYLNNPWNMIALFAGIVLFTLTLVQTIYTIKGSS